MPDTLATEAVARTAVIDVGSNSVRLVIFGDSQRAPLALHNEKASCQLGAGLPETGRLNPDGVVEAIDMIKRFRRIAGAVRAEQVLAFATAAVRDADDGPAFVARVAQECGVRLDVISGAEEAHLAGMGVLFGIPAADGLAIDMGGSSLELAPVGGGKVGDGVSLPLGPLQFGAPPYDIERVADLTQNHLDRLGWLDALKGKPFYLVGGTWRAFAKADIAMRNYELNIIHGYSISASRGRIVANLLARQSMASLKGFKDLSSRRLNALPATSTVLEKLIRRVRPGKLVFSAHGVREGIYFDRLSPAERDTDPLIAGVEAIALHEQRFASRPGGRVFEWIAPLFNDETDEQRRLRRAACQLADVGWRTHPDYRATQSYRRVLRAPLLGVDHAGRLFLAIAVLRRYSQKAGFETIEDARALLEPSEIRHAEKIGAAMRLAMTLAGGDDSVLAQTSLQTTDAGLELCVGADDEFLASAAVHSRLQALAKIMGTKALVSTS